MKGFVAAAAAVLGLAVIAPSVAGHHSTNAMYDESKTVEVTGSVVQWRFVNPHPYLVVEVTTNGKTEKWVIGGPAINRMEANGWSRSTVKPGDQLTGTGYQFADGQKIIRLERVVLPDGKEMRLYAR